MSNWLFAQGSLNRLDATLAMPDLPDEYPDPLENNPAASDDEDARVGERTTSAIETAKTESENTDSDPSNVVRNAPTTPTARKAAPSLPPKREPLDAEQRAIVDGSAKRREVDEAPGSPSVLTESAPVVGRRWLSGRIARPPPTVDLTEEY